MVVEVERLPVEILAAAAGRIAATSDLREALGELARAAAAASRADVAVLRILDEDGALVARGIAPEGSTLAAEVAGARAPAGRLATYEPSDAAIRAAARARAADLYALPAVSGDAVVGSVELIRIAGPFGDAERAAAALVAAQLALVVRTLAPGQATGGGATQRRVLELAGDALAAGGDPRLVAEQALRAAIEATRARGGAVWQLGEARPELLASLGPVHAALGRAAEMVAEAAASWRPVGVEADDRLPDEAPCALTLALGEPPFAALQLFYREDRLPPDDELAALTGFAARTAHALRSGQRTAEVAVELERAQTLLEVVGETTSRLSLAHTLETGIERIASLLPVERVGVYLSEAGTLFAAAGRGLVAGHTDVAERLFEAALGPLRARATIEADVRGRDPALAPVRAALRGLGQERLVAVPLRVRGESIGLLVAAPASGGLSGRDVSLLAALAAQLAVAVQNARLHEHATELGQALGVSLESERQASRQIAALYEISRSFAQTLSLDATLEAVTETLVRELGVDAAVIRVPDERGDQLVPRAVHVVESRLAEPVRAILAHPQRRPGRIRGPQLLDLRAVTRIGGAHALLRPFLEKGSTAALHSDRDSERAARRADHSLARPRVAHLGRDARHRPDDRPSGGARDRQRPPLLAAEAVRRDDAALAAAARAARGHRARRRPRLRVGRPGRRRRRRLRLPRAPGRPPRRRARGRHRARHRRDGRHGDGEVHVPLARARAFGAVGVPRPRERRRRGRDRARQVHHHGLRDGRFAR